MVASQDSNTVLVLGNNVPFALRSEKKRNEIIKIQQCLKNIESLSHPDNSDFEQLEAEKKQLEMKVKELEKQKQIRIVENAHVVANLDEELKASTAANEKLAEANKKLTEDKQSLIAKHEKERQAFIKQLEKKDCELKKLEACLLFYCVVAHAWWS